MKYSELIKLLKKSGCYMDHHGTRHDIWYNPISNCCFTVPRHKHEVPVGTTKNILKAAGINTTNDVI